MERIDFVIKELDLDLIQPSTARSNIPTQGGSKTIIIGKPGTGKCLAPDTKIIMYDGHVKKVQDVVVGDLLMGDDSTPRTVLSTCEGEDDMFEIKQRNGDAYVVNKPHILCLRNDAGRVIEIPVSKYCADIDTYDNFKGYKTRVSFKHLRKAKLRNSGFSRDTKLMMSNFQSISVEHIVPGDTVLGDDGTVRTIIDVCSGRTQMYRIQLEDGTSVTVSGKHDLWLKHLDDPSDKFWRISAEDYLALDAQTSSRLRWMRRAVDIDKQWFGIDPFVFGFWMSRDVSSIDSESAFMKERETDPHIISRIVFGDDDFNKSMYYAKSHFINFAKYDGEMCSLSNQHKRIPGVFKHTSKETRRELITGFIQARKINYRCDTSPSNETDVCDITSLGPSLVDDVVWICHSLAYKCVRKTIVCDSEPRDVLVIENPCMDLLFMKFAISESTEDEFFGFEIDNDKACLLQDFSVCRDAKLFTRDDSLAQNTLDIVANDFLTAPRELKCVCADAFVRGLVLANNSSVRKHTLSLNQQTNADDLLFVIRSTGCVATYNAAKHEIEIEFGRDGETAHLNTDITVREVGRGKYHGFQINGNGRFLLGDFTVTHNTTLIASLLYAKKHIFPVAMVMSGSEDSNHYYKQIIPSTFVYNEYNAEIVEKFVKRQKISSQHIEVPWAVLLLDDCTDDPRIFNTPLQHGLFKRGRHFKMWYILSLQYAIDVKPVIRVNTDQVFVLREPSIKIRKVIWENYASIIPDFNMFCQIMDQLDDYTALFILNATTSNKLEDCVFYYKATPVPPDFRFGCQYYWDFHNSRYNDEYKESF
jgi:hypothetical protein